MQTVNTHEAKTHLSKILTVVKTKRKTYRICRNGEPMADIVPIKKEYPNPLLVHDPDSKKIKINYDPVAPLDPEDWPAAFE
jgi:antitoxin (DNA-binding transcriptional repressor) of toxin-antitoxin stability system